MGGREIAQSIVAVSGQGARDRKLIADVTRRASKAFRILNEGGDMRSAVDPKGNLMWSLRALANRFLGVYYTLQPFAYPWYGSHYDYRNRNSGFGRDGFVRFFHFRRQSGVENEG
jgi:hypothetical protein